LIKTASNLFYETSSDPLYHHEYGVSRSEFGYLVKRLHFEYESRADKCGRPFVVPVQAALEGTLIFLRKRCAEDFVAWWVGEVESTSRKAVTRMLKTMETVFTEQKVINIQSAEERLYNGHWFRDRRFRMTVAIDGLLRKIQNPPTKVERIRVHSGKEGEPCVTNLGAVNGVGKFIFLSDCFPGSFTDQLIGRFGSVELFLKALHSAEFVFADAAFHCLLEFNTQVLIPDTIDNELNSEISKHRSLIERAWRGVEEWEICAYPLRFRWTTEQEFLSRAHSYLFICVCLYNLFHKDLEYPDVRSSCDGVVYSKSNK